MPLTGDIMDAAVLIAVLAGLGAYLLFVIAWERRAHAHMVEARAFYERANRDLDDSREALTAACDILEVNKEIVEQIAERDEDLHEALMLAGAGAHEKAILIVDGWLRGEAVWPTTKHMRH